MRAFDPKEINLLATIKIRREENARHEKNRIKEELHRIRMLHEKQKKAFFKNVERDRQEDDEYYRALIVDEVKIADVLAYQSQIKRKLELRATEKEKLNDLQKSVENVDIEKAAAEQKHHASLKDVEKIKLLKTRESSTELGEVDE